MNGSAIWRPDSGTLACGSNWLTIRDAGGGLLLRLRGGEELMAFGINLQLLLASKRTFGIVAQAELGSAKLAFLHGSDYLLQIGCEQLELGSFVAYDILAWLELVLDYNFNAQEPVDYAVDGIELSADLAGCRLSFSLKAGGEWQAPLDQAETGRLAKFLAAACAPSAQEMQDGNLSLRIGQATPLFVTIALSSSGRHQLSFFRPGGYRSSCHVGNSCLGKLAGRLLKYSGDS